MLRAVGTGTFGVSHTVLKGSLGNSGPPLKVQIEWWLTDPQVHGVKNCVDLAVFRQGQLPEVQ